MKNFTTFLFCVLFVSSCYTYQVYEPDSEGEIEEFSTNSSKLNNVRANIKGVDTQQIAVEEALNLTPKQIIKANEFYQMKVFTREAKIQAVKWEGDTLVATVKGQPTKVLKVHEQDIQDLKVRKFSKGRSDALTVAGYVAAGVGVLLLLK